MAGMTAVVLAPERSAESVALVSALEAGLGRVRLVRDRPSALAACVEFPRATLVIDLRAGPAPLLADATRLRSEVPAVRTVVLVDPSQAVPPDCDAVFTAPFFLEDVVRWCARSLVTPVAAGIVQDLAAGLCHEIGNPLQSLFLQVEMLRADERFGWAKEHLLGIEEAARRIQSVVRDVAEATERHPVAGRSTGWIEVLRRTEDLLRQRAPDLAPRVDVRCDELRFRGDSEVIAGALCAVWEYMLRAGGPQQRLAVEAGRLQAHRLVVRQTIRTSLLPLDAAARLFTPLWARQALGLSEGISLTSARNAFVRHHGDLRAFFLKEDTLVVEGILPDETQATFEFPRP